MKKLGYILFILIMFSACKQPQARQPISRNSGTFIKESAKRNKLLFDKEKETINQLIKNDTLHNYIASENGFWYYYTTRFENDTITPKFGDLITYNYNIKDLNGNLIYSQDELKTQQYAMDQQELFSGLREGLKLMKAGEQITFILPSLKAYGYYGDANKIGANVPIKSTVIVKSISKK